MTAHFTRHGQDRYRHDQVILGLGRHIPEEQLHRAWLVAQLAQQNPETLVVISGYNGEAHKFWETAIEFGMSRNQPVALEPEATNMRGNFELSVQVMRACDINPETAFVMLTSCLFCAPRAFLTHYKVCKNMQLTTAMRCGQTYKGQSIQELLSGENGAGTELFQRELPIFRTWINQFWYAPSKEQDPNEASHPAQANTAETILTHLEELHTHPMNILDLPNELHLTTISY